MNFNENVKRLSLQECSLWLICSFLMAFVSSVCAVIRL